jgi:hypothetical protein
MREVVDVDGWEKERERERSSFLINTFTVSESPST